MTVLLFLLLFTTSRAERSITTSRMRVVFSDQGDILTITPCFKATQQQLLETTFFATDGRPILRFETSSGGQGSICSTFTEQNDSIDSIRFLRTTAEITYRFSSIDYSITATVLPVNRDSTPATPTVLHRHHAIAVANDTVLSTIIVTRKNASVLRKKSDFDSKEILWVGARNRFWALLVKRGDASIPSSDGTQLLSRPLDSAPTTVQFYAGPVDYRELGKIDHSCTNLLYPLWRWMRWLSIGLLALFNALLSLTGNCVLSIVLLSLAVKIILGPLYFIAHRLQKKVNQQKSIIEPKLQVIRKEFKGEEQTKRILALHKELGISPMYTLKSLVSAGIQIPVFFAAYHMLSENIALLHMPLLWIGDLALPDQMIPLPFTIPWIGNRLNIFPFVMTAITIASSYIHTDRSLSVALHRRQQRSLYGMALFFFILLYTSPAGMLLYWTMNNLLSLISSLFNLFISREKPVLLPESEIV